MLPPVDEQTIRDNPEFAKLYRMLLEKALNPDGSTKDRDSTPGRDAAQQDLHRARTRHAKALLLKEAIRAVSLSESTPDRPQQDARTAASGLQTDADADADAAGSLADVLALLPSLLSSDDACPVPDDAAAALFSCPPLSALEHHLPELGALVSANLHAAALDVARIAHPSTNPSYLHRHIPSLPADFSALSDALSEATSTLAARRLEALSSLTRLLHSYTQTLTLLVRTLESKHGLASRSLELQALDVSQNSQLAEVDAKTALHAISRDMYSPETVSALANYSSHLRDAQIRAAERLRGLQAELAEYGVGVESDRDKEKKLRDMAIAYRHMESQMEEVKKDLARLEKRL
ncbi:hypothetical protein E4U42_002137 [Claviceps africana]|uniref:Uncharacterized protein n=1 Tax=Claviceps africana TaxID=83212 RepID=A0A8K0J930_9HYPO|nr:hypothetical protein E4U42_002137 [Claviceps africana]